MVSTDPSEERFVSTGALPPPDLVQRLLDDTHQQFRGDERGACSTAYPALTEVDPDRIATTSLAPGSNGDEK